MNSTDRIRLQRRFAARLSELGCIAVWFSQTSGRIHVRSEPFDPATVHVNLRGRPAIPMDVIPVGHYAEPFSSSAFLDDLDEAIRRHEVLRKVA